MPELHSREYLMARVQQCRQSAANARDPSIQALHLDFAKRYEQEAQKLWIEKTKRVRGG